MEQSVGKDGWRWEPKGEEHQADGWSKEEVKKMVQWAYLALASVKTDGNGRTQKSKRTHAGRTPELKRTQTHANESQPMSLLTTHHISHCALTTSAL